MTLNHSQLKIIALITMIIDHVGAVFFPEILGMRIIGRIAFPIYCFLLVEGYYHTSDFKKYLMRLLAFACVSEVFFNYAFMGSFIYPAHQNIFFTLALGLTVLKLNDVYGDRGSIIRLLIFLSVGILAQMVRADYGLYGIALIILMNSVRGDEKKLMIWFGMISVAMFIEPMLVEMKFDFYRGVQGLQIIALPLLLLYNGQKGISLKYFFYAIYPLHLLMIAVIRYIIM